MRWCRVRKNGVFRGVSAPNTEQAAPQWFVNVTDTTGRDVDKLRVIGSRAPLDEMGGLYGGIAGNALQGFFLPSPWTMAFQEEDPAGEMAAYERWDEYSGVSFRIHQSGRVEFRERGNDEDGTIPHWLVLEPEGETQALDGSPIPEAKFFTGDGRVARAGTLDGANRYNGDFISITEGISPNFVTWVGAVTTAVNLLPAVIAAIQGAQEALEIIKAQVTSNQNASAAPLVPGYPPAAPVAPPAAPPAAVPPNDNVPGVDDLPTLVTPGIHVVGRIRTGSPQLRTTSLETT